MNEVILSRKLSLERCVRNARSYYALDSDLDFSEDFLRQDAVALNIQRACELTIDMANHLVKIKRLGLPQESKEAFVLLHRGGVIPKEMMDKMQGMVGFRNVLVHRYQEIDFTLLVQVIDYHLLDLVEFSNIALAAVE